MRNIRRKIELLEEELELEGIIDATSNGTSAKPMPPEIRAAIRDKDLENAKKTATAAAKKIAPAISKSKPEISKMKVDDVKKLVKDFGSDDPTITPDDSSKASAAVLNLTKRDSQGSKDVLDSMKSNPKLRAAVISTPGMTDLQSAVDSNLRAQGKNPKTAVGDSWRELGHLASRYNLSERSTMSEKINESKIKRILREEFRKILKEEEERSGLIDLMNLRGEHVARWLSDQGDTSIAYTILNPASAGVAEYLFDNVYGQKYSGASKTFKGKLPLDRIGFNDAPLSELGFRDGEFEVIFMLREPGTIRAIRHHSLPKGEKFDAWTLIQNIHVDINFYVYDEYEKKRIQLGELRSGGNRVSMRMARAAKNELEAISSLGFAFEDISYSTIDNRSRYRHSYYEAD